jgi:hypothetical protein
MENMRRWAGAVLSSVAGAMLFAACDKNTAPVPIPTPLSPATQTENYTGTLTPGGSNLHFFQIQQSANVQVSEVRVTLTQLVAVAVDADPNADPPVAAAPATPVTGAISITIGQGAVTTIGVQCASLKTVVAPPGTTAQLTGQAIPGSYCVSITDTGDVLPRASTYAVTVAHS